MTCRWTLTMTTLALGAVLAGCARSPQPGPAPGTAEAQSAESPSGAAPAAPAVMRDAYADGNGTEAVQMEAAKPTMAPAAQLVSAALTYSDGRRRFVRTANARFRVRDTYAAALAIEDLVAQQQGFVTGNQIHARVLDTRTRPIAHARRLELTEYIVEGRLTVRVPSERTQALLRALASQIEFLDARSVEANDVQFDLLAKALARQREEQAQQELGAASARTGRADHIAEVIAARNQARASRDGALVEQRRIEDRIAFSTLTLSLYQPALLRRTELPDLQAALREHTPSFGWRLAQSLRGGWEGLQVLALRLATLWPLWFALMCLALGAFLLRRGRRGAR